MIWVIVGLLLLWVAIGPWVLVAVVAALSVRRIRWWVQDRIWIDRRRGGAAVGILAATVALVTLIPDGWLPIPQSPGLLVTPRYVGRPAAEHPALVASNPGNPNLARNSAGSGENAAAASGSYPWAGPMGLEPEVDTTWSGLQECGPLEVDTKDRLIAMCGDFEGPTMQVVDRMSMRTLASKDLPEVTEDGQSESCSGAFYLDPDDRAVVATADRRILRIRTADAEGKPDLTTDRAYDLTDVVREDDCVVALLPDWSGRIWFATHGGLVGTVAPRGGEVQTLDLGSEIANSIATDETGGAYVVSTDALYRLSAGASGVPAVDWHTDYDRGSEQKSGQFSQGSGTAPTIIDGGIVAITDNTEPRMNVAFYERSSGREICKQPVFSDDSSATQNSLASVGDGVVVTNNYGYGGPASTLLGRGTGSGIARVDVAGGDCKLVWTSEENSPSGGAKVSLSAGVAYAYTKRSTWWGVSGWYLTALDVTTGRTVFSVRAGTGLLMNNDRAAITITSDGTAWIPTLAGLVRVRDRVTD